MNRHPDNLRKFPVAGLRRHTPRRGLTAEDYAALLIVAGFFTGLALLLFAAHLALTL
jgi:hypothetical protein